MCVAARINLQLVNILRFSANFQRYKGSNTESDSSEHQGKCGREPTNEQLNDKKESNQDDPYARFPDDKNPLTGEIGGPRGPEPTRYGDWERKGRVIDF